MYTCTIVFQSPKDAKNVEKLFASEKAVENDRASFVVSKTAKEIMFTIHAKDAVALRATANAVMKTLAIYEKVRNI